MIFIFEFHLNNVTVVFNFSLKISFVNVKKKMGVVGIFRIYSVKFH